MKIFLKRLRFILGSVINAYFFFILTIGLFVSFGEENILASATWNLVLIVAFIAWEKVEGFVLGKIAKRLEKKSNILLKAIKYYLSGVSFKTSLYLFYLFITVLGAVLAAQPDYNPVLTRTLVSSGFELYIRQYLLSVQHGILVLFAADGFLKQIFKESKT
ncbi:MAG: hypothetical protein FWD97_01325 [Defluviitaleaceae bacterium]|nr:hypothetical protein [Defluviitaleaceae bacterium]